jgi:hypothetical protein
MFRMGDTKSAEALRAEGYTNSAEAYKAEGYTGFEPVTSDARLRLAKA